MTEKDWKRKAVEDNELVVLNTPPGQPASLSKVNTERLFYQYRSLVPASASQA